MSSSSSKSAIVTLKPTTAPTSWRRRGGGEEEEEKRRKQRSKIEAEAKHAHTWPCEQQNNIMHALQLVLGTLIHNILCMSYINIV